ncbi:hypothetical protein [Methylobacterium sp. R2-1]|nr:hypothetical protein [Methylobacterium sp. R2-1]MBB2964768.1 hypothetical protein [Methylobacterium sp. R2-1]
MAERLEVTVPRSAAKLVELGAGRAASVALDYPSRLISHPCDLGEA